MKHAVVIGNSDGIGLAVTKKLIELGWTVQGISRSESSIRNPRYSHIVADVQDSTYSETLKSALDNLKQVELCIYCVGIGELLDFECMEREETIMNVNLIGMIKTVAAVVPVMVRQKESHFIGLSSVADEMVSSEAPSYSASKAGFSNYLEGLAFALKPKGVHVTNIRFGFVDTKMAKADKKPFMMSVEKAADHVLCCIDKKTVRYTAPKMIIPIIKILKFLLKLKMLFNR